jgi:hypothetical protein
MRHHEHLSVPETGDTEEEREAESRKRKAESRTGDSVVYFDDGKHTGSPYLRAPVVFQLLYIFK